MLSNGVRSSPPKPIVMAERWRRYKRDGDREARDQLILAYSPLVKHVAGRIASGMPAHVELAELVSYGLVGLISAVERYDPARGIKFESFAGLRIRGAIFDELRTLDWVPRAVRQEGRDIERANAALLTRLQRLPTDAELAAELSLDAEQMNEALQRLSAARMVALDQPWNFNGSDPAQSTLLDTLADPDATDPADARDDGDRLERVAQAVQQLSGREQTVLALRYHQELNFAEIGEVFQVTESRVSQIHTKAVMQLRALLTDGADALAHA